MAIPFTEFNDIKLRPEEYNQDLGINRVANQMLKNDKANVKSSLQNHETLVCRATYYLWFHNINTSSDYLNIFRE